jgi:hypothetical protein
MQAESTDDDLLFRGGVTVLLAFCPSTQFRFLLNKKKRERLEQSLCRYHCPQAGIGDTSSRQGCVLASVCNTPIDSAKYLVCYQNFLTEKELTKLLSLIPYGFVI